MNEGVGTHKVCRSCGELKLLEDYHRTPVSRWSTGAL
jgi:hypothetical protein